MANGSGVLQLNMYLYICLFSISILCFSQGLIKDIYTFYLFFGWKLEHIEFVVTICFSSCMFCQVVVLHAF